jgi:hypothetical protein
MRETRSIDVRKKVFSKDDLRHIWSLLNSQKMPERLYLPPLTVQIKCADGIRYESDNGDFLNDGNIVDLKKIKTIDFEYRNLEDDRKISVSLTHGDSSYSNDVTIAGGDADWVAGTFNKFQDILAAVRPQEHWFFKNRGWFFCIEVLAFGWSLFILAHFTIGSRNSVTEFIVSNPANAVGNALVFGVFGAIPASLLQTLLLPLWPNVEFFFGPEHFQFESLRRKRLAFFLTVVVLPSLLSLIPIVF